MKRRLRIFTWHIHGSYLYYLSQIKHDIFVPVKHGRPDRYFGKTAGYQWPENLHEIPAEEVKHHSFDCLLYQHSLNYSLDQFEILSPVQRNLPRVFLEHDPPLGHPAETRHVADNPEVTVVHVTPFNALMWDNGPNPVRVIDHGILPRPDVSYSGQLERGLVIVNEFTRRGRRVGPDVYLQALEELPLDVVGMGWERVPGGIGEIPHQNLFAFAARYRFLFNPIRYTSLNLAVLEAMSVGVPVVALATTEMATVIQNGVNGYASNSPAELIERMKRLLADPGEARRLGEGAKRTVVRRFGIKRFIADWTALFEEIAGETISRRRLDYEKISGAAL